jgi:hypothetical protein
MKSENVFSMKIILTVVATGVISVLAGASQALAQLTTTVTSSGTAPSVCYIVSTTDGVLALSPGGGKMSTDVTGGSKGTVVVKCAQGSALTLGTPILTAPVGANATTTVSRFNGGSGSANFANATGTTISPIKTKVTGATANVSSVVTAKKNNEFITPGAYKVVVPAILIP